MTTDDELLDRIRDWLQVDQAFLREPTEMERRARELFRRVVAADPAPTDRMTVNPRCTR